MDGILLVNKPKGMTSNTCVNKIKHYLNVKVGHTGTLDEMVEGLMVLCLGKATKLTEILMDHQKEYYGTCLLGAMSTTEDSYGEIIKEETVNIQKEDIDEVLKTFIGDYMQVPPMYSAIKQNGKRLYELARKGIEVPREARLMNIEELKCFKVYNENGKILFDFKVVGSRGLYVRTLCVDIAKKLKTIGLMSNLKRTRVGEYDIINAYTLEEVLNGKYDIIDIKNLLVSFPRLVVKNYLVKMIYNGVTLDDRQIKTDKSFVCYAENGKLLALYQPVAENKYKPVIIFEE